MALLEVDWTDPVTRFAVPWLVAGIGLVGGGLHRIGTYSCGPDSAGCGDSFGSIFVLWGVLLAVLWTVVLVGRIVFRNLWNEESA
jgi:hypothetical protein